MAGKSPEQTIRDLVEALHDKATKKMKLGTLAARSGFKAWSGARREAFQQAAEQAGVYPRPRLTAANLRSSDWIEFSHRPYHHFVPDLQFPSERQLQDFLFHNYRHVSALSDLKKPLREANTGFGAVDLLFREKKTNDYVVVELESGDGGYEGGSQLLGYVSQLRPRAQQEGVGVRGVIITGAPNEAREDDVRAMAAAQGVQVDWYCYRASLELVSVFSTDGRALGDHAAGVASE